MASPLLISDHDIKEHFDETGSIRETARRTKLAYSSIHERLVKMGAIHSPVFHTGKPGNLPRTIPDAPTLVIPDTQAPAHHPDTLAFLCAVRDLYRTQQVIWIGDEIDLNWLSDFAKMPEADQPHSEWAAAKSFMRSMYAEFPEGSSLTSNHVHGRLDKARLRGRIPPEFLRPLEHLIDAPVGWSWHSEIRMGDVLFRHGHKDKSALKSVILEEIPAKYGRHLSLVIGHYHQKIGQATSDMKIGDKFYWGAFTGCLIDPKHIFFGYSKGYEKLGCAIVMHGRFIPIAMPLREDGRWTGKL